MHKNRVLALLLALLVALAPLGAFAEEAAVEAAPEPGALLLTELPARLAAGEEVVAKLGMDVSLLPGLTDEQLQAVSQIAQAASLCLSMANTADGPAVRVSLQMQDTEIAYLLVCANAGALELTTSLLPGKTFVVPQEALVQTGGLALQGVDVNSPEMQALTELVLNSFGMYFYVVAGWVSNTQYEHQDLYVYTDDYVEETDVRDASVTQMHAVVRSDDFRRLLRLLADTLYADAELQAAIVDAFKDAGATQENVFAAINSLCVDVLGQEGLIQATDGATEFVVSYGEDYGMVGFDGTMPAMWEGFPFDVGTLTYSRKTQEESVVHTAQGSMTLANGMGNVDGTLAVERGELLDTGRTNGLNLNLMVTNANEEVFTLGVDEWDSAYDAEGVDCQELAVQVNCAVSDKAGTPYVAYALAWQSQTGTQVQDGALLSQTDASLSVQDVFSATLALELSTRAYAPVDLSGNERVDVSAMDAETTAQLESELSAGLVQSLTQAMSLIPQEALITLMSAQ